MSDMYESLPISQWTLATELAADDFFIMTDTSDKSESPNGTTKKAPTQLIADYIIENLPWVTVTTGPVALTNAQGYISNGSTLIVFQLPTIAAAGDQFRIEGLGAGFFRINQNVGQSIIFDNYETTVGTSGSIESTTTGDGLMFMCVEANTKFKVRSFIGTFITT